MGTVGGIVIALHFSRLSNDAYCNHDYLNWDTISLTIISRMYLASDISDRHSMFTACNFYLLQVLGDSHETCVVAPRLPILFCGNRIHNPSVNFLLKILEITHAVLVFNIWNTHQHLFCRRGNERLKQCKNPRC